MVDLLHLEFRKKFDLNKINFDCLDSLPKGNISLAGTVQYLDLIKPVKNYLEKKNRKVIVQKGAFYEGHVLGCQSQAFNKKSEVLLLLCDGKFHAMNNAVILKRGLFVFDSEELLEVHEDEIKEYYNKIKGKQMKFLSSKNIGLIVSNKFGQKCLTIKIIKNKIEKLGKKVYLFEGNDININEFENFLGIEIWVNTCCFGLAMDDKKIINFADIVDFI